MLKVWENLDIPVCLCVAERSSRSMNVSRKGLKRNFSEHEMNILQELKPRKRPFVDGFRFVIVFETLQKKKGRKNKRKKAKRINIYIYIYKYIYLFITVELFSLDSGCRNCKLH